MNIGRFMSSMPSNITTNSLILCTSFSSNTLYFLVQQTEAIICPIVATPTTKGLNNLHYSLIAFPIITVRIHSPSAPTVAHITSVEPFDFENIEAQILKGIAGRGPAANTPCKLVQFLVILTHQVADVRTKQKVDCSLLERDFRELQHLNGANSTSQCVRIRVHNTYNKKQATTVRC